MVVVPPAIPETTAAAFTVAIDGALLDQLAPPPLLLVVVVPSLYFIVIVNWLVVPTVINPGPEMATFEIPLHMLQPPPQVAVRTLNVPALTTTVSSPWGSAKFVRVAPPPSAVAEKVFPLRSG